MHLHVHTHVHIKETPFCLVALVKSQNQLRGGAVGLAALKVFKSRSNKSISPVPPLRAEEHLWRTRFLLMQTAELSPIPACGPAAAYYLSQIFFYFKHFYLKKKKALSKV